MKKESKQKFDDDLRPEYDLKALLKTAVRGKYVNRLRKGSNLVLLEPDVADEFPDGQAVNETLRLVMQLRKKSLKTRTRTKRTVRA